RRFGRRFAEMLEKGALEEVEALAARGLDPILPAMKALGVPPLLRHLRGEISRQQAIALASAQTRQYAKRQFTWFKHQLPEFEWVSPGEAPAWLQRAFSPSPYAVKPAKV